MSEQELEVTETELDKSQDAAVEATESPRLCLLRPNPKPPLRQRPQLKTQNLTKTLPTKKTC